MKCNTCQNERYCYDGNHQLTRDRCADNGYVSYAPMTNADYIRAMTDEELARLFLAHDEQFYRHCPSDKRAEDCYADLGKACDACEKCWLDWLKSPVEEVGK